MSSVTSSLSSLLSGSASSATSAISSAQSAMQQAAESIISGATGNTTVDPSSLVTAIVNEQTAGQAAQISTSISTDNTMISAYGSLSSALSNLQNSLTALSDGGITQTYSATTSGSGVTATAGVGAVPNNYALTVNQIASAQSLTSGAYGATEGFGTGTLTITLGSGTSATSASISIDSSNDTLSGIAAAINGANNNPGVTATVVNGADGAHLVLSANSTGASNVISISSSVTAADSTTGNSLSTLDVTSTEGAQPGSTTTGAAAAGMAGGQSTLSTGSNWTQTAAAQDAEIEIGAIGANSSSNNVSSAISGVTLNLSQAAVGTTQTLGITPNTTAEATDVTNFVTAYNTVITTINSLTSVSNAGSTSQSAGVLVGDSTINTIMDQLQSIVAGGVNSSGVSASLAQLGISINTASDTGTTPGTLAVDQTTLNSTLTNNPTLVSTLFNPLNGVGVQLDNAVNNYVGPTGLIATSTQALNQDLTGLQQQQSNLNDYVTQLTSQYQAKFTALDNLMAQTNQSSEYLTALFGGANSAGSMATVGSGGA